MMNDTDRQSINHILAALALEMTPRAPARHHETDTLFVGGPAPTEDDQDALGRFGLSKNYKLIHATFENGDQDAGLVGFHAVLTDGLTQAAILSGGRLWKRDNRSPAVLVFADSRTVLKLSGKRRLLVREMKGRFHDEGYSLAINDLKARASWKPGGMPVASTIGMLPIVMNFRSLNESFAAAA